MRTPEERRIEAWGLPLAGRFWPGEGTPILALHGWLDNANSFLPLAAHLGQPLFALDFAGHGKSAARPLNTAVHYIDNVRDVLATADALGWQRFVLLGHSMGAGVASLFAGTFPDRVVSLVLLDGLGPPSTPGDEAPATLRKAVRAMQDLGAKRKPRYPRVDEAVAARTLGFGGLSESASRLLCERGLESGFGGWTWRSDARLRLPSSLRLTEEQVCGFLHAIQAPTLLVGAAEGLEGAGTFAERAAHVQDISVVRVPGGHHVHMDAPASVAEVIRPFLAR
ncbi:alpha/beta fold family hydrolase [Isoalcanivorax pacificus W11-5]|uniref:Alpha/beta fold family hydrolase n=1 Tax=Isoalcanivorax pacificus W11-5 TaxID=391936 RepID=A0A0B4XIH9_9GAMM|nr:alpha/beta hydrolase [Isoalcanivorax pacificus]AJD48034.1 alpha/beta fold family hydrolase [Isoalcanivorax pacificus W11-5]